MEITGDDFCGLDPEPVAYTRGGPRARGHREEVRGREGRLLVDRSRQDRRAPSSRQRPVPDHGVEAQLSDRFRAQRQVLEREDTSARSTSRSRSSRTSRRARCRSRTTTSTMQDHPGHGGGPLQERRETEERRSSRTSIPSPASSSRTLATRRSISSKSARRRMLVDRQGPARQSGRQEDPYRRLRDDRARRLRLLR